MVRELSFRFYIKVPKGVEQSHPLVNWRGTINGWQAEGYTMGNHLESYICLLLKVSTSTPSTEEVAKIVDKVCNYLKDQYGVEGKKEVYQAGLLVRVFLTKEEENEN